MKTRPPGWIARIVYLPWPKLTKNVALRWFFLIPRENVFVWPTLKVAVRFRSVVAPEVLPRHWK